MKKLLLILGGVLMLGAVYWLVSPLFITKEVHESTEDIQKDREAIVETLSSGTFQGLLGHSAEGTAKLIRVDGKYFLRFENDFKVTNGPDLFVYFGKNNAYVSEARLGVLKGNVGGQNYEVPTSIDPLQYTEAWIWCRSFSVPFGKAVLIP